MLATQTLPLKPFKTMAITVEGELRPGVTAKDIILAVIAKIGTGGCQGYVLEYRGRAIRGHSLAPTAASRASARSPPSSSAARRPTESGHGGAGQSALSSPWDL